MHAAWDEAPGAPPARGPRYTATQLPSWAWEALALVVAVAGPLSRAVASPANRWWVVLLVGTGASAALALLAERLWPLRLAVLGATLAILERAEGPFLAVWLAAGLGLSDWAIRRRRPLPFVPVPDPSGAIPVTILLLVAALQGRDTNIGVRPTRLVVLAFVLTCVGAFGGDLLPRAMRRLGHLAGIAASRVIFLLVGLLVVVVPWVGHRLFAVDPLTTGRRRHTAWVPRIRLDPASGHPWSSDSGQIPVTPWYRVRRAVAAPLALGVTCAALIAVVPHDIDLWSQPEEHPPGIPAAYAGVSWWQDYQEEAAWTSGGAAWQPLRLKRVPDLTARYTNVSDGVRASWTAPSCGGCRRIRVWVYGGSTLFGLGQRDVHTIPSELARLAWADGFVLDVENRGVPGDMHWIEANRLSWDLTQDPPPDLVVFYDGVNEIYGAKYVHTEGDVDDAIDPTYDNVWQTAPPLTEPAPPGAELVTTPSLPSGSDTLGLLAVERYERSRQMSRDIGEARDLPMRWFWQPSRFSRDLPAEDAWMRDDDRPTYEAAEGSIPDGVGDLTHALDGTDEPLFVDDVHHNEEGARLIADALYEQLRGDLMRLADGEDIAR